MTETETDSPPHSAPLANTMRFAEVIYLKFSPRLSGNRTDVGCGEVLYSQQSLLREMKAETRYLPCPNEGEGLGIPSIRQV